VPKNERHFDLPVDDDDASCAGEPSRPKPNLDVMNNTLSVDQRKRLCRTEYGPVHGPKGLASIENHHVRPPVGFAQFDDVREQRKPA